MAIAKNLGPTTSFVAGAQPTVAPQATQTPVTPQAAPSTFTPGTQQGGVAGVHGNVAQPPPPPPLTGTPFSEVNAEGTIYDAKAYLADRLKIADDGALRLFHHTAKEWGIPGVKTKITMRKNDGSNGHVYGP